ncbi:uncharacterized protein LOC113861802 isoform X2 [Abrus precatorius]|uniref:Uncharacterized protein LOC113861802 isoform X2 n=1 Tax=Abrus precatorius TaxID=3816 RepID=A0A8B8L7D8_ABRPR|nr:uncharacterized protein LOC113861802 isoform X2 [Abrus precatorius]
MEEIGVVQLQDELHKLSCIKSEETLERVLCTLWITRKTGLRPSDKSDFQSLLHLPSPSQLEPVLACLRSLIRKCAYQNLTGDELLKLFPPDLPLELQSNLVLLLQKNRDRWKEEISPERVRTNVPSVFLPPWPRHDGDSVPSLDRADLATAPPILPDVTASGLLPCFQCDNIAASDNLNLPCLKSMTWTMENRGSSPSDRVAVISLKLHDYSKSPLGETEVKFQLTRDTLEAMLRSMQYISEQLSAVGTSSGPVNKKQKQ